MIRSEIKSFKCYLRSEEGAWGWGWGGVVGGGNWPADHTNFQLSISLLLGPETNQPQRLVRIAAFGFC